MQIYRKKSLFIPLIISGLVVTTGSLSAQSFAWVPASTSVPMSPSSLIILAILFMGAGLYLLMKSQNAAARSLFSILLLAGMFGFVNEVKAANCETDININTHQGNQDLYSYTDHNIHNNVNNIAIKITIDPDGCEMESNCNSILQPGDGCLISLGSCEVEEER